MSILGVAEHALATQGSLRIGPMSDIVSARAGDGMQGHGTQDMGIGLRSPSGRRGAKGEES